MTSMKSEAGMSRQLGRQLKPRDLVRRHCRKDCSPFRYSASGIAGLH
jgi:hypothetical protein